VVEDNIPLVNNQVLWLKLISLKTNILVWQLLLKRVPTKDSLVRRQILAQNDQNCSARCG